MKRRPPGARRESSSLFSIRPVSVASLLACMIAVAAVVTKASSTLAWPTLAWPRWTGATPAERRESRAQARGLAQAESSPQSTEKMCGAAHGLDEDIMCNAWAKARLCQASARAQGLDVPATEEIRRRCPLACGLCAQRPGGRVPPVQRADVCRRDNHTPALRALELGKMFERIMADYPQYSPHALSTDPWCAEITIHLVSRRG